MNLTTSLTSPEKFVCHSGKWFQAVVHVNMFVWLHICNCMYVYTVQVAIYPTNLNKYIYIYLHAAPFAIAQ